MAADFDAERLSRQSFKWRGVPRGGPELQFRVARRAQLQQVVVAAIVELEPGNRLRVAAVEALGQPQNRRKRSHRSPCSPAQVGEPIVLPLGCRLPMITRDERDGFDLIRLEAAEVAVLHKVIRVFVMSFITDVDADVVEDCRVLEPLALAIGEAVDCAGLIEQPDGEASDVQRMLRPVVATFRELEHASSADVGIPIGLSDFLPVTRDVIEDDSLAQRQIAQRDFVRSQPPEDLVHEDCARHRKVRAPRFETRHAQPLLEVEGDQVLADAPNELGRESPVAQRCAWS